LEDVTPKGYVPREASFPNYLSVIKFSSYTKYNNIGGQQIPVENRVAKYPNLYAMEDGFYIGDEKQEGGISASLGLGDGVTDEKGITTYRTVTGYTDDWDSTTKTMKNDVAITENGWFEEGLLPIPTTAASTKLLEELVYSDSEYYIATRFVFSYTNSHSIFGLFNMMTMRNSVRIH
jgi:hypothetical protein